MPTIFWNLDTNFVTAAAFDQSALQFQDTRGSVLLTVICTRGDVNSGSLVLLDAGQLVGIVLRDPSNLKGAGYLAGPTLFTRGATPADGYLATVSTDTTVVRTIMHVDDTAPELPEYPANAVLYHQPIAGGPALESLPFAWTILPSYFDPGLPPADILELYPSAQQLLAAVAAAASAQPRLPTPTTGGMILTGNPDHSVAFVTLSSLLSGAVTVGGTLTAPAFAGDGSAVTNLNPANLSGPVPLSKLPAAVAGGFSYAGAWDASANTPPLTSGQGTTGAVYRVSVAGGTALDGVNTWLAGDELVFDGARWEKFDGAGNEVLTVDGVAPVAGAVALPGDQAAAVASKRTLGTGPQQAAAGNDARLSDARIPLAASVVPASFGASAIDAAAATASARTLGPGAQQAAPGDDERFPAAVTGIRKGNGAGQPDTAAVVGTDLAPCHPVVSNVGIGFSGNGTLINVGSGADLFGGGGSGVGSPGNFVSDTSGTVVVRFNSDVAAGTLIGTIQLAAAYATPPGCLQYHRLELNENNRAAAGTSSTTSEGTPALGFVYQPNSGPCGVIAIYVTADGVAQGSTLAYQYYLPPQ